MSLGGGSPGGQSAGLFIPPGQAQVAGQLQPLIQPMANQAVGSLNLIDQFGGAPASVAYPGVVGAYNQTTQNPYASMATGGALTAFDIFQDQIQPQGFSAANKLSSLGDMTGNVATQIPGLTFDNPTYGIAQSFGSNLNSLVNPYLPTILSQGFDPRYEQEIPNAQAESQLLNRAGAQIVDTGFDPQNQLYDRTQQRILDQTQAANAASGVASTPYGAGVTGDVLKNFNIDWENQQLSRETAAAQAASGAFGQARALPRSALDAALTAGVTGAQGAGTVGNEILGSVLTPANAQTVATTQGLSALGQAIQATQAPLVASSGLLNQLAQGAGAYGAAPYNTVNTQAGNIFGAAQNLINEGDAQYLLPQQTIGDLMQYLGLGQSASTIANQIGATNFAQSQALGQGLLGGAGQAANLLGGSGGIGSLFGGGVGGAAGIGADFGGGGAALGVPDALGLNVAAGAGADAGASLAPLAFLGS